MKIMVTDTKGFIGKNLIETLEHIRDGRYKITALSPDITIYVCDVNTSAEELDYFCQDCDFVFNLAGINRPKEKAEIMKGNFGFCFPFARHHKNYDICLMILFFSTQEVLLNPTVKVKR